MGFFEDIARAEREAERVMGTGFTFEEDGEAGPFRCVLDMVNRSALSVGEINQDIDATAEISMEQLDDATLVPTEGTILVIGPRRFVVLSLSSTQSAYSVSLKLME